MAGRRHWQRRGAMAEIREPDRSETPAEPNSSVLEVGVDVGGTFTDLVLIDPASGAVEVAKVPTSPENQAFGVLNALAETGRPLSEIAGIVHGTTATTNALLERKVARAGLITTHGFRDILELGRRTRPTPYGLTGKLLPLIPRDRRVEVSERMDASGQVLMPLDEPGVESAANALLDAGCEAIVVHFLHAYANPEHERRAARIVARVAETRGLSVHVVAGHLIVSEFREYERGTTATVKRRDPPGPRSLSGTTHRRAEGSRLSGRVAGHAGERRHGLSRRQC